MISGNGKSSRQRNGCNAMEQRMVARAVKRARAISACCLMSARLVNLEDILNGFTRRRSAEGRAFSCRSLFFYEGERFGDSPLPNPPPEYRGRENA